MVLKRNLCDLVEAEIQTNLSDGKRQAALVGTAPHGRTMLGNVGHLPSRCFGVTHSLSENQGLCDH